MSIQSEIDRLNAAKADIQSALVEGGQTVEPTDTLTDYAGKVRALSSGFGEQLAHHNEDSEAHSDIRSAIPTKTSDLANDEGFITNIVDSDLEVSGALRVTDHAVFQNGVTVNGSLITPGGEEVYLHSGNISSYAIPDGGGQVSGDYTLQGDLTLGELYADILNLGSDEDGVYAGVYRDHNGVINLEIFGRENDDPVRLNGIETPIGDYSAANKLYVDTSIDNATPLIVTFSDEDDFSADCTFAEIYDAISADRQVIGRLNDSGEIITYSVAWYGGDYVAFLRLAYPNIVDVIWIYDDDSYEREEVSLSPYQHTHTPASIGAVSRSGDQISGNYSLQGNLSLNGEVYINDSVESDLIVNGSVEVAASSTFHDDVTVEGALWTTDEEHSYIHTGNISSYAAPPIACSTTDLTAGSSSLTTGTLYVVYE